MAKEKSLIVEGVYKISLEESVIITKHTRFIATDNSLLYQVTDINEYGLIELTPIRAVDYNGYKVRERIISKTELTNPCDIKFLYLGDFPLFTTK